MSTASIVILSVVGGIFFLLVLIYGLMWIKKEKYIKQQKGK